MQLINVTAIIYLMNIVILADKYIGNCRFMYLSEKSRGLGQGGHK